MILDTYARESDDKRSRRRRKNMSIAGQHSVCRERVQEYGATLGLQLEDVGKSAWNPKVKRPKWEHVLSRLESGQSNGVVIFDIERLLRRIEDAVRIVKMAEKGFLVIDSDGEYDLTTPSGQKNFYEAAIAAQHYSHRLSTRVKRGYNMKIAEGEWIGGRWRMFGFEPDATTVRESEAVYVREIAERLLKGRPPREVRNWLQSEVGNTSAGVPWSESTLRRLMINPRLAGYIRRKGEIVGTLNSDPILKPTVWQEVVKLYASRSGRTHTGQFLCTGIVIHDECGHTINGENSPKGAAKDFRRYEDGTRAARYYCPGHQGGCGRTIGDVRALDRHIKALVIDELSDPQHTTRLRAQAAEDAKTRAPVEAEIDRLQKLLVYWGGRLNAGKITSDYHEAMVHDVDQKIVIERAKLSVLREVPLPPPDEFYEDALSTWTNADPIERRELLKRTYAGHLILVTAGYVKDTDFTQRLRVKPAHERG